MSHLNTRPVYAVVCTDCQSSEPDQWQPIPNTMSFAQDSVAQDALRRSHQGIDGDKYGVIEYSAEGAKLVGDIYPGINEW